MPEHWREPATQYGYGLNGNRLRRGWMVRQGHVYVPGSNHLDMVESVEKAAQVSEA